MLAKILISADLDNRIGEMSKILPRSHPDLLYFEAGEKLGMEQAKIVKDHFSMKPYSEKGRVLIIEDVSTMTLDAQNTLLKTLEEPPEEAVIILGTPMEDNLLPTLLSRCEIIVLNQNGGETPIGVSPLYQDIQKLLSYSIQDRFEYIEKLKDKAEFLEELVHYFHQELRLHPRGVNSKFIKELIQAEEWAKQNVNIRAILEYLMLVMP